MKKPQMHILIEGFQSTGHAGEAATVTISQPSSRSPIFHTSHQVFHDVLTRHPALELLPFVVHSYRVNAFTSLQTVCLTDVSGRYQFSLKSCKPKAKPQPKRLGVRRLVLNTPRKRKRKVHSDKDAKDAKKTKARGGAHISLQELVNLAEKGGEISSREERRTSAQQDDMVDDLRDEFPDLCGPTGTSKQDVSDVFDSQSELETSSSETDTGSLKARSSSEQSSDTSDDSVVEEPLLTVAEAAEERETKRLFESHKRLMKLRGDTFCKRGAESEAEAEVASASVPTASAASSSLPTTTFCNKAVGLVDIGTQVAARLAGCRHCGGKVQRGTARIGYAYSTKKFHSWLHPACTANHLRQENASIPQALAFLKKAKEQDHPKEVQEAITLVEGQLR